jgi:hypothetical protein
MLRFAGSIPLGLLLASAVQAGAPVPTACATFSQADAIGRLGGPLGEVEKLDRKAEASNGGDHRSSCGYFPKGYHFETAEGPPERGIVVELHALPSADAARRFYEGVLSMHAQTAPAAAAPTTVTGIGEAAYLKPTFLSGAPSSRITTLTFRKGSVVASVQVWKNAAPVDEIARGAAMQVLAKLP